MEFFLLILKTVSKTLLKCFSNIAMDLDTKALDQSLCHIRAPIFISEEAISQYQNSIILSKHMDCLVSPLKSSLLAFLLVGWLHLHGLTTSERNQLQKMFTVPQILESFLIPPIL
jgi:hypothetical protein